jgi:mono/diheme cytochrome c family protein
MTKRPNTKQPPLLLTAVCLASAAAPLSAADVAIGKALHGQYCTSCHDDSMYTRKNRHVKSMDALTSQIGRCDASLGLKWFDDEIEAVAAYLNKNYYHFK